MSDMDAMLEFVKSIDTRTARIEETVNQIRSGHDDRIKSLETSRAATRAGIAALAIGGTGAGAKLGMIDKLMGLFSS